MADELDACVRCRHAPWEHMWRDEDGFETACCEVCDCSNYEAPEEVA